MSEQQNNLDALTRRALVAFGLGGASFTFLRHNENAVYRVEAGGVAYVLRLHIAAPGMDLSSSARTAEYLRGELEFIETLYRGGLPVQQPVRTADGALLAILAGDTQASLLRWLPGAPLDQRADDAETLAYGAGELAASLHNFVLQHPETAAIPRPAYDGQRVLQAVETIADGVALGLLDEAMLALLRRGGQDIAAITDRANDTPGAHGLIHADLGLGNLIVHEGSVSIIDFGLCGHGPLLMDVGGMLGAFDLPKLRRAMLAGYRALRPAQAGDDRAIEAHFLIGVYLFMAMHLRSPLNEWFGRRLPKFAADYVKPFVAGEPFLYKLLE